MPQVRKCLFRGRSRLRFHRQSGQRCRIRRRSEQAFAELHKQHQAEEQARAASKEQEHQSALFKKDQALSEKDGEIARLKEQISAMGDRQKLAVGNAVADKDKIIVELRAAIAQKESAIQIAVLEEQQKAKESLQVKEAEIAQLRSDAKLDKSRAELHEKVIREDYENRLKVAQE